MEPTIQLRGNAVWELLSDDDKGMHWKAIFDFVYEDGNWKAIARPTGHVPVGQPEKYDFNKVRSRHFDDIANDYSDLCLHGVDQNECTICNPAAPTANALPEDERDQEVGISGYCADGWHAECTTAHVLNCGCMCHKLARAAVQLAAAQQEIAQWKKWGVIEIAIRNPNVDSFVKDKEAELTALRQSHAALLGAFKASVAGRPIRNADEIVVHAELLGGKK